MPGRVLASQGRRGHLFPRCVVEAEIRNSSRPGSQAPHAPPALTFGLPGKQRVNRVQAGGNLIRLLNTLPGNRNIFINGTGQTAAMVENSAVAGYFCVRFVASAI
jgi:hypothetical protein